MVSVSIEARPAVTTEACGVVGANCILGALLLGSKNKEKVIYTFKKLYSSKNVNSIPPCHIPGTRFLILCSVPDHWDGEREKEGLL